MNNYTFIGRIETGEAVYFCPTEKSLAIEKDHNRQVEPTAEEKEKIYKMFPKLKH
jgi:hypothetical protein